ncbi:MAG: S8 family peptidase [Rhodocyclaceae bacterium]|nr:S8 family peptidase [Rhodocyclaceae bacterium]
MNRIIRVAVAVLAAMACASAAADARVIVKLRDQTTGLRQAQAVERTRSLAQRIGVALAHRNQPAPGMLALRASGIAIGDLLARLADDPAVEFAVEDRLRTARALPNDPLFDTQWYLQSVEAAAIGADRAWDIVTGDGAIVVAVLDTGIRPGHPDLAPRLVAGYDFITDAALSGDGDGRDADPSDVGDFIDAAAQSDPALQAVCGAGLLPQESSWHGTRVAGIIAAAGNNSLGISGVNWNARVLPLRVLGKCGGFDSDIIAAMRWAAGLSVPGLDLNPTPARIINMSLGGEGACTAAYEQVIQELLSRGVLVVSAAGNETGPVESPANCAAALAVGGLRHIGTKVGYSSLGPEIDVSAPAGNCVNPTLPCLFPIDTTSNAGTTTPAADTYTDGNVPTIGTSFSAPQVAGVAALMLSANPALGPNDLIDRIKSSARPFPSDPTIPTCPVTATGIDNLGQCNCTTLTCGAGMLDAGAAVAAAAAPVAAISAAAAATAGTTTTLDAGASVAMAGRTIVGWLWSIVSAPDGASLTVVDAERTGLQTPVEGSYVVRVTVTDSAGASDEAVHVVTVSAAAPPPVSEPEPSGGGGGGGGSSGWLLPLTLLVAWPWLEVRPTRRSRSAVHNRPPKEIDPTSVDC